MPNTHGQDAYRKQINVDKSDFLKWSRKYDKDQGWSAQKEQELGARFRKAKTMTCQDLAEIVEWKFKDAPLTKKQRVLDGVGKNDEATVARISSQVFCIPSGEDSYRMNSLVMLNGVSPVLASVILAFFDPRDYGIFDNRVWRGLLGNEPPNLYSTSNYLKLLAALRKTAGKHNLDVRIIEKALYKKSLDAE
jgi:hypothetical protein